MTVEIINNARTHVNTLDLLIDDDVLIGSKLPSALPTFLGSMQGEGLVGEEEQPESSRQEGAPEDLATFCSSEDQAMMQDCYSKIVEKLSLANHTMVLQVGGCTQLDFYTVSRTDFVPVSHWIHFCSYRLRERGYVRTSSIKNDTLYQTEQNNSIPQCVHVTCYISYGQKESHITRQFLMILNNHP